jgi:hypothetical protein
MESNNNHLPIGAILGSGERRYCVKEVPSLGGFGITYKATAKVDVKIGNIQRSVDMPFVVKEHFINPKLMKWIGAGIGFGLLVLLFLWGHSQSPNNGGGGGDSCMTQPSCDGTENGHEWVDLGLSVRWATMNLGANIPEDYGSYFAWGETRPKNDYSWSTYKYGNGSNMKLTKYNNLSKYGTVDNRTVLERDDDVASVKWGGSWRMPTYEELGELNSKCTWTWTTLNGHKGYQVKGPNGNSIFLPAAGYRDGTSHYYVGSYGGYWSTSFSTTTPSRACYLYFDSGGHSKSNYYRESGQSVRPVTDP